MGYDEEVLKCVVREAAFLVVLEIIAAFTVFYLRKTF